ncbi:MAG: S41 family peptidase, partial [bacterium]
GKTEQVTRFKTHDVKWPAIGPDDGGSGEMVLQHGDQIYVLDLATNASRPVSITVPGDRETLRVAVVDAAQNIQGASISPSGKRVAVVGRGDIWSAPAENGTPRNMTRTDGVFERSAAWSPDGKSIAFFSDATGEYELYTMPADGKPAEDGTPVPPKQITKPVEGVPSAFRTDITWAPDSKSVVIQDKAGHIDLVKLEDGSSIRLDKNPEAPRSVAISFSHDSRWIAWSRSCDGSELEAVYLYDTKEADAAKARTQVTSGFYSDSDPTFDRKGDWLVFTSQRNFSPAYGEFDTTWIYNNSQVLMAVPLKKDFKLPWLPTSDEEGQKDDGKSSGGGGGAPAAGAGAPPAGGPPAGGRRRRGAEGEEANLIAASPEAALVQDENKDAKKDAAASTGAAGTWNCMVRIDNAPVAVKLVLTETGGTVKGTASSIMGATELTGTYDAATGALKLSGNFNGMVFELDLKVEGDSLTGTASGPGEDGAPMRIEMTGTRVVEKKEGDGEKKDEKKDEKKEVVIDLDGFEARAVQLPAAAGSFGSLGFNDRNELLYGREGSVRIMDLSSKNPSESTGASGMRFELSGDGKKLLMGGRGGASIANASAGASAKPIVASPMLVEIHPRHEREQILVDAWRIFRDYFYDQGMHGIDWNAIRAKYEAMLPAVVTREDLNYLIAEMISELNVGHAYLQGPGDVEETASRSVGMLGVEFAPATKEDGTPAKAWKLAKFVNGASFDNEARSPLSAQGLGVGEGDYLLAVNGEPVDPSRDPWSQFLDLAGKPVVLTVSKKPVMDKDAKDVVVTALASESNLHYRAWVESKRRQVEELSGGKIGYIYVPNTGVDGQTELVRQFYGQRMKPSLIIDDRWNGGGQIPTRFIELLNRPVTNYWARRDARDGAWPPDGHRGPKAMLINGLAGSGGDMFPWLFKHNKLGPVIGTRTWGGLVGISGNPGLIDGGSISVPTFGFYEVDGTWGVEGHGIDPDIEVIDDPAKMKNGGDPQLEKAVEVLLKELETNAYKPVPKPKGPDRRGMGLPVADR